MHKNTISHLNIDLTNNKEDYEEQKFWSTYGAHKNFTDPFYLEEFSKHLQSNSTILEYGCGYGRILSMLQKNNFSNVCGVDWAEGMVKRAQEEHPQLNVQLLTEPTLPFKNETFDAVILSTVLCCNTEDEKIERIVFEIQRTLKKHGILYFCEFLITDNSFYQKKYETGFQECKKYGTYRTNEGVLVRHFSVPEIKNFFRTFTTIWEHHQTHVTMNNNEVEQYHSILKAP